MKCNLPLLLTLSYSTHADRIEEKLKDIGEGCARFNADNPDAWFNFNCLDSNFSTTFLDTEGNERSFDEFGSLWYDRIEPPRDLFDKYSNSEWAYNETRKALDWIANFSNLPTMDNLEKIVDGHNKAKQLHRAVEFGLKIPNTLISSDFRMMKDFASQAKTIYKPIAKPEKETFVDGKVIYTSIIDPEDITPESVSDKLSLLQHYVSKRFELRAFVIGDSVLAAEIHSQNSEQANIDWRRYDIANTPHYVHELPHNVADSCRKLVHSFGLRYSAIDLILDCEGDYIFLENNPQGLFLWIEDLTTLPVSRTIAEELVKMTF